jgi:hypothetical protein
VFPPDERPWEVNFYGTISALESEKQKTRTEAQNTGALLLQSLESIKNLGMKDPKAIEEILAKIMLLDEDQAALITKAIIEAIKSGEEQDAEGGGGFGGGGDMGGGPVGNAGGTPAPALPKAKPKKKEAAADEETA